MFSCCYVSSCLQSIEICSARTEAHGHESHFIVRKETMVLVESLCCRGSLCVCPHLSRPSAVNRSRPSLGGDSGEGVELEVWLLPQLFTADMARMSEHTGEIFIHLDRAHSPWWLCQISLISPSLPCVSLSISFEVNC